MSETVRLFPVSGAFIVGEPAVEREVTPSEAKRLLRYQPPAYTTEVEKSPKKKRRHKKPTVPEAPSPSEAEDDLPEASTPPTVEPVAEPQE